MISINSAKSPKSSWEVQKGKLKLNFPKLTDADLNFVETRKKEMLRGLEPKLAMTTDELTHIMEAQ